MKATIISDIFATHHAADCMLPGPVTFRLTEPLVVQLDGVRYRAPAGARTDGASTPRLLRSLVPRVGRHLYGAIIHDAAYRGVLERQWCTPASGLTWVPAQASRPFADRAFFALMVATGTGWLTRWMAYVAVRLFGRSAYRGRG